MRATVRPPPAPPAMATCLSRSASAGRARVDGNTARGGGFGRSTSGSGSSVRRAFRRKPGSRARLVSSVAVRVAALRASKADIAARRISARLGADARDTLINELREHALVVGEVTLTSGRTAQYYLDVKRAILLPAGFKALAQLVAAEAQRLGATAVGGTTMGADPIACAALAGGADVKAFFVRKDRKEHGLQRWVEGPFLDDGDRCLVVEDVVTTGGSTMHALEKLRDEGRSVVGVVSVLDRLAGGGAAIEQASAAPYVALTTIDDVYPDRPDR